MTLKLEQGNWTDQNFENINQLLETKKTGLAVFDFDNTLIYNDLGEACMYYIALQGMLPGHRDEFWQVLENSTELKLPVEELKKLYLDYTENDNAESYKRIVESIFNVYHNIEEKEGLEAAYRWTSILFAFHSVEEWKKISQHVLAQEEQTKLGFMPFANGVELAKGIRKYNEIYNLIQVMLQKKWKVMIVTASPQEIIAAVANQWGLQESDVVGMTLAQNPSGEYLSEIIEPMPFQQGKLDALYNFLGKEVDIDFAAGDSPGDKNLLEKAKTAVLIDRGNAEIRDVAKEKGFLVQPRFINPL